jgi:hypothetical protein
LPWLRLCRDDASALLMDERASRAVTDMDRAKKMHLHEELARKFSPANSSKAGCFNPGTRKTQQGNMKTLDGQGDEVDAHKPRVLQLNLQPSLIGLSIVTSSDAGKRAQSSTYLGDSIRSPRDRRPTTTSFEKARAASGVLYPPSPQVGGNHNSSILNAVHFTFGDASATGSGHVTDKIYQQLLEQARSHKCTHGGGLDTDRQCNNSMSIPAMYDYEDTDDNDIIIEGDIIFEIPSKAPFRCSHDQQHYAELVMVRARPRPSSERWSSNKKSFHLNLEQQHRSTTVDPESRDVKAREKLDVSHRDISFDGGSRRLKQLSDSFASERSGLLELESEMDDFVLDSGRLKIDVPYEPDLDKPYLEQVNKLQAGDGAKMDEDDFPFNSPIASSFLFEEPGDARPVIFNPSIASMARTVVLEMDSDDKDLDLSDDAFHDGSISDTDSSLTIFSLEAESSCSVQGQIDQHTQWISTRSFNYLREVVDHNSGFLNIESLSGRFSVDLRQEKRLEKVSRPGVRVSMRRSAQSNKPASSRRSLLAPCLVCLSCIHQRPAQAEQP